jgi:hypothetical protein
LFEREHHVRVAVALQALDGDLLEERGCVFGGGTAIALSHGEYRESVDLDFLISDLKGYRALRQELTAGNDLAPISRAGASLPLAREIRANQYGIRTMLSVGGVEIKFEIVFESRIALGSPRDRICGVPALITCDMAATALLANSDRWADDGVFSRDLIDLAMLQATKPVLRDAMSKAKEAYGDSVERDLIRAIDRLRDRPARLEECMAALKIDSVPKAVLWARIRGLRPKNVKRRPS